jgi:hypothetical protein
MSKTRCDVTIERCRERQPCDFRAVVGDKLVAAREKISLAWHVFDPTVVVAAAVDPDMVMVEVTFDDGVFKAHFNLSQFDLH